MGDAAEKLYDELLKLPESERRALARRVLANLPEAKQEAARRAPGPTTPLIEKTPGVVSGSARIARTRIPVWTLESYRRQGLTDAEILDSFPTLRAVDLAAAWSYASTHPDEIAQDIQENDAA
jgi:uncharacterized protein (DUF433 family)